MGYERARAIIVSGELEQLKKAHHTASIICQECPVTNITKAATNGEASFLVAWDGSKWGWDANCRGREERREFISWLVAARDTGIYLRWAEVQYCDDEGDLKVLNSSREHQV